MEEKIFLLYADCRFVRGARRSLICDLTRAKYDLIPNDLYDVFILNRNKSIGEIRKKLSEEELEIFDEYLQFLLSNEYGAMWDIDEISLFPEIDTLWDFPAFVTNGIIDMDINSCHDFQTLLPQFENLGCKHILIRNYGYKEISYWDKILNLTLDTSFKSIELVTVFSEQFICENIESFMLKHKRLRTIILTHSPYEDSKIVDDRKVIYTKQKINTHEFCGKISPNYFTLNNESFFENMNYNSCLNRKIAVDIDGAIKNCPSMKLNYGNISNTKLETVLLNETYTRYWHLKKDNINVCKLCEFRYLCSDCRAFLVDESDVLSKPKKCNYDPITASWN